MWGIQELLGLAGTSETGAAADALGRLSMLRLFACHNHYMHSSGEIVLRLFTVCKCVLGQVIVMT